MVWDTDKSTGDTIFSDDWDAMVADQKEHASEHEVGGRDVITGILKREVLPSPTTNDWTNETNIDDEDETTAASDNAWGTSGSIIYDLGSLAHTILGGVVSTQGGTDNATCSLKIYVSIDNTDYALVTTVTKSGTTEIFGNLSAIGYFRWIKFVHESGGGSTAGTSRVYEVTVIR